MPKRELAHFKLTFQTYFNNEEGEAYPDYHYTRVIKADSSQTARIVADAMIGEEVNSHEFLHRVITVAPTQEATNMASWDPLKTNQRVVYRLSKVSTNRVKPDWERSGFVRV